jgi:hypothetical protein
MPPPHQCASIILSGLEKNIFIGEDGEKDQNF